MPNINEAKVLILNQFNTGWAGATPVAYEDEEYDKPIDRSAHVRLTIREYVSRQETLGRVGTRRYLREGAAFVEVFVPEGKGTKEADDLSELVRTVLEGVRVSGGLWFLHMNLRELPVKDAHYRQTCEAIFNYEQTK